MGECVVVVNQKGGVGKTTTAVNLGAALAEGGCRTLLVDLDPQSNATAALGAGIPEEAALAERCGVYAALCGDTSIREQVYPTRWTPLSLVPATVDLAGAEVELADDPTRGAVKNCLAPLLGDYDIVLLDTPPSLGVLTVNCLVAADSLLVPVQCEYFALEGLRQLLRTIGLVRDSLNPELAILGLLRTMYDGRTNLSQQVAAQIEQFFPGRVFSTLIPRNVRLSEAPSFGQPVTCYAPMCAGTAAYRALAKEVAVALNLPYEATEELAAPAPRKELEQPPEAPEASALPTPDPVSVPTRSPSLSEAELIAID
jgi:chromosome partitioning protein